jgi:hypothetical protein
MDPCIRESHLLQSVFGDNCGNLAGVFGGCVQAGPYGGMLVN